MMNSAVFGQIIILVVYLPILTLHGIEGKMFKPMAQTVAFALLGAFILSLTYVPMISALILSKNVTHKPNFSDRMMNFFERHFQSALDRVLHFPKMIISGALILFTISVFLLLNMGGEFIPALEEGDFAVETRVLSGSSLSTSVEYSQKAAAILKNRFPEVIKVITKIGSGEIPTDPMPMDAADMMIILKDRSEWTSAETFNELSEKMSEALADLPGVSFSFQYPVQMRFNELMTGAKQDVVCKIFGENIDTLAAYAKKLGELSGSVDGAQNIYVEPITGAPQVVIEYNRAAIAQFGLSIHDINKVVNMGLAGQSAGFVYEGEKRFDLVVRLKGDQRKNMEDVRNMLVPTSSGQQIPLSQLASVELKNGPNQIQREDAKRRTIVGFNVRGRDVQSIVNELQEKADKSLKLPSGYFVTYGGAFENLNAAKARLSIMVPVSLLLIFLLLYFSFHSVRQGLLIYSAIPLSAIGGILALTIRDMPFSISAGVGFIALFGVSVLNGIVLVAEFNRLKEEGWTDLRKIVLMGTKIRLRPVLMTAFVASLGFLPMALSKGAGAEVQRPLATVVIGGLLIATFLTLFVLPVLYILFESRADKKKQSTANTTLILLISLIVGTTGSIQAQTPISLQTAIDSALANNLQVKKQLLLSNYQKQLQKTAWDIPQANFNSEYGQINSRYSDNRFGISQSFSFPTVYAKQKTLLSEEYKSSVLKLDLEKAALKKAVSQVYYSILFVNAKEKLLFKSDSIYAEFLIKAEQRFSQGESNVLEKASAEMQRGQIAVQIQKLLLERSMLLAEFHLLLNTTTLYSPENEQLKISQIPIVGPANLQHPQIRLLEQEKQISIANYKLNRSQFLPSISMGYNNMTMFGSGSDNKSYTYSSRFQSGQFGLGIPLFYGAQRARVKASGIQKQISENDLAAGTFKFQIELSQLTAQLQSFTTTANFFEQSGLKNANLIMKTASLQFQNGDINYLDWALLNNQAISIENDYLEAIHNLNAVVIQINYLNNN
jgi:cobalt-zinc-cadmium resistance protein CzcA